MYSGGMCAQNNVPQQEEFHAILDHDISLILINDVWENIQTMPSSAVKGQGILVHCMTSEL